MPLLLDEKARKIRVLELDEIRQREHYQRALLDSFPFMMWLEDKDGRYLADNVVLADVVGATEFVGKTDFDFSPEELAKQYVESDAQVLKSGIPIHYAELVKRHDGGTYWAETYKSPVAIDGKVIGTVGFSRDISESQQLFSDVMKKEFEYVALLKNLPLSIIRYDITCRRTFVSLYTPGRSFNADGLLGKTPLEAWSPDIKNMDGKEFQSRLEMVRETGTKQVFEVHSECASQIYINMLTIVRELDKDGSVIGLLTIGSDVTEMSQYRSRLEHLAFHDALTDLPGRTFLNERMQLAAHNAVRNQSILGLLFLDLDFFKAINDTLDRHAGDKLLIEAAKRIRASVRSSDLVARIGGDEFAALVMDINSHHDLAGLASKIGASLAEAFEIDGKHLFLSASIGIAWYPHDADNIDDLIKFADTAMYQAKKKGRNNYQFYATELTLTAAKGLTVTNGFAFCRAK